MNAGYGVLKERKEIYLMTSLWVVLLLAKRNRRFSFWGKDNEHSSIYTDLEPLVYSSKIMQ